jgi:pSer/pThr/pTyr-binding forkhead associated (FHA) protein
LTRPYYSIGRERAKIVLPDRHVSRRHLAVAQVGPDWLVINRSEHGMRINGEALTQKTLRSGDILRIGQTSLVFDAGKTSSPGKPLRSMAGLLAREPRARTAGLRTLETPEDDASDAAQVRLLAGQRLAASSTGQPLLLGSHPVCTVRLTGTGIAPVHALLTWLLDGLHLLDLDSGQGTLLDGQPVRDSLVHDGQAITVGEQTLSVRLAGDPCSPALSRASQRRSTPKNLALSVIYGPHTGETVLLPLDRPVRMGSTAEDDLSLPKERLLVNEHLELIVLRDGEKKQPSGQVAVHDLHNRGDIHITREKVAGTATATVGDVMQFGTTTPRSLTALFLHYDTRLEAW